MDTSIPRYMLLVLTLVSKDFIQSSRNGTTRTAMPVIPASCIRLTVQIVPLFTRI